MPLVRIELIEGRTAQEVQVLADTVHEALMAEFAAPQNDRLQIIQQHRPEYMTLSATSIMLDPPVQA